MNGKKDDRVNKIIGLLIANPQGMWLRQLAIETNIPISTLHRYIEYELQDIVESVGVKDERGKYFGLRIIRLKPKIVEVIESGGMEKLKSFLEMSRHMKI